MPSTDLAPDLTHLFPLLPVLSSSRMSQRTFLGRGAALRSPSSGGSGIRAVPSERKSAAAASALQTCSRSGEAGRSESAPRSSSLSEGDASTFDVGRNSAYDHPGVTRHIGHSEWESVGTAAESGAGDGNKHVVVVQRAVPEPSRTMLHSKRPTAGPGWQNNFVRMNLKVRAAKGTPFPPDGGIGVRARRDGCMTRWMTPWRGGWDRPARALVAPPRAEASG